jgi:hypothetical protein
MTDGLVPLKEYIESLLVLHDEKQSIRFEERDKALQVLSMELSRRLEELNHAHRTAEENFAKYLPRETHEGLEKRVTSIERGIVGKDAFNEQVKKYDERFETHRREIELLRQAQSKTEGKEVQHTETQAHTQWSIGLIIAVLFSSASLLLGIISIVRELFK